MSYNNKVIRNAVRPKCAERLIIYEDIIKGKICITSMLDIAQHVMELRYAIKDISMRQEISDKYLEQIISI